MKAPKDLRLHPDIKNKEDAQYWEDAKGSLIPVDMIKPIDKQRNTLVMNIVSEALNLSATLAEFKQKWNASIDNFVDKTAKSYDVKLGGKKGNITLLTFDGKYKVQIAIAERIVFDERLQIAKKLVDECLNRWTKESRSEIKVLINNAFEVDKQGKINTEKILGLRRLNISDEKWKKAMNIISESVQVASTKSYMRIYERDKEGKYNQVSLDFASL